MHINKPVLTIESDSVTISVQIETKQGKSVLWYKLDKEYTPYLVTEKLDGFLVALLPLAMQLGEDIHLAGPISQKLYYNLSNYYIHLLHKTVTGLKEIKIFPDSLDEGSLACAGANSTAFSAGIDSFCCIADHLYDPELPKEYKLTHFIFNNTGSHGDELHDKARILFNERYNHLKSFPAEVGLPYLKIDSNLSEILKMDFQKTHTPRNLSTILLLQKLFKRHYYASTYSYADCFLGLLDDMACSDPIALSLLSTETTEFIASGSQYQRTEKTKKVSLLEAPPRYLNVCIRSLNNCSACFKCMRTLLTLDILGKLDLYKLIFDLNEYKRNKTMYVIKVLSNPSYAFNKQVIDLAEEVGYTFGFMESNVSSLLRLLPRKFVKLAGKLLTINLFHKIDIPKLPIPKFAAYRVDPQYS